MGTVVLKMSEEEFWNCTHKKFKALLQVHSEVLEKINGSANDNREECISNIRL